MLITYLRSSSYTSFDFCPFKTYLRYTLGLPEPSGFKACKGNMVHKALELLAGRKLAEQNGLSRVVEAETGTDLALAECTPDRAMRIGFDYYCRNETHHSFSERDYRECRKWLQNALDFRGGLYNPLKRHIIVPEVHFDFTIDEPWARYDYVLPDGQKLSGQLAIKGTADLLTRHPTGVLELIDWKTGQRKDWATGQTKDFAKLCVDAQLRLYHYAMCRLFPAETDIFVSIFFVQFLEPFSIPLTRDDLKTTAEMIRQRFEVMKATSKPKRIWGDWKCKKLCHYGKTPHAEGDGRQSICEYTHRELLTLGMDRVDKKYMDPKTLSEYGAGGGKSSR